MTVAAAPSASELEVSVFGPGVGECIVMHLGNGDWVVVDSCKLAGGKEVALEYLEAIGVDPGKAVKRVVVTHWHDDHMRGASEVLKAASAAMLVLSSAVRANEFQTLVAIGGDTPPASGVREMWNCIRIVQERLERHEPFSLSFAADNSILFTRPASVGVPACEIRSLSPSAASQLLAAQEVARLLPKNLQPKRAIARTANEVAVVLWVDVGGFLVLLGSDLEESPHAHLGWQAIVASRVRPQGQAHVVKVPHHGSETAYSADVWKNMLRGKDTHAFVTPFRRGKALPTTGDVERLLAHTENVYATAPAKARELPKRLPAVDRHMKEITKARGLRLGKMGHVRLRVDTTKADAVPQIEMFEGAALLPT